MASSALPGLLVGRGDRAMSSEEGGRPAPGALWFPAGLPSACKRAPAGCRRLRSKRWAQEGILQVLIFVLTFVICPGLGNAGVALGGPPNNSG